MAQQKLGNLVSSDINIPPSKPGILTRERLFLIASIFFSLLAVGILTIGALLLSSFQNSLLPFSLFNALNTPSSYIAVAAFASLFQGIFFGITYRKNEYGFGKFYMFLGGLLILSAIGMGLIIGLPLMGVPLPLGFPINTFVMKIALTVIGAVSVISILVEKGYLFHRRKKLNTFLRLIQTKDNEITLDFEGWNEREKALIQTKILQYFDGLLYPKGKSSYNFTPSLSRINWVNPKHTDHTKYFEYLSDAQKKRATHKYNEFIRNHKSPEKHAAVARTVTPIKKEKEKEKDTRLVQANIEHLTVLSTKHEDLERKCAILEAGFTSSKTSDPENSRTTQPLRLPLFNANSETEAKWEKPNKQYPPNPEPYQPPAKTAPKVGLTSIPEDQNRTMLFPNSASSPSLYSSRAAADVKKQKEKNTVFGQTRRG